MLSIKYRFTLGFSWFCFTDFNEALEFAFSKNANSLDDILKDETIRILCYV